MHFDFIENEICIKLKLINLKLFFLTYQIRFFCNFNFKNQNLINDLQIQRGKRFQNKMHMKDWNQTVIGFSMITIH